MIKANNVVVAGGLTFTNVNILTNKEVKVPLWFEDDTYGIVALEGTFILPSYNILLICLKKSKIKLPDNLSRKVSRLSIADELTFGPCYVVHPGKHLDAGVPQIFKSYDQFTFCCSEGLFVTTDFHVNGIKL
jgi:hypothetical protein